ncbi:MAG: glycosyltransferase family 4 protein [Bacteroidetes bacterium]|nr:glycosyltransferase family 4 protein [Bacteroidota bacterium]
MKLNLAYLCNTKSWGGLEMNQIRNAFWMKERGHNVHVFVTLNSPAYKDAQDKNLTIHVISKHKRHYDFYRAFKLFKLLTSLKIHCLIVRSNFDMSIAASISYFSKRKIKTVFCMEMQLSFSKKQFFRTWRYSYIDAWCCPLNYMKEQVLANTRMNREKIFVVPSGIDIQKKNEFNMETARIKLNLHQKETVFGILGRIDPRKGQKFVIEIWKNISDASLLIQGDIDTTENREYLNEIYHLVETNKLEDRIVFLPFSSNVELFFAAIDALIVPSENETVGMVTIEAILYKKPVIGSKKGGTLEILSNHDLGLLFEVNSQEDLLKRINEFTKNKREINPDIYNQEIQKYNKEKVCDKMENILGNLVKNN